jgi:hypothetical protein
MTYTLADLRRKLKLGQGVKLVNAQGVKPDNPRLNLVRYVIKVQGNGVYLNSDKTATKGSFLELPKASLMEMDETGFKTFTAGLRELTPEEQEIIKNEPQDAKQEEIDLMTDGSQMFYRRKAYYTEKDALYLFSGNSKTLQGKYLIQGRKGESDKIRDDAIKGEMSLSYEFTE